MKLYKYSGTIEEFAVERGRISYIKLFDVTDFDKAPTRLEVFGALSKYIEAIESTDAEERYIKSDWYFDSNLYLYRIEIPGSEVGRPAKIITQSPHNIERLEIFGQQDYIKTSKPESMSGKEIYRCPTGCWFAYTMEIFGGNRYGRNAPVTEWTVVKRSLHRLLCHGDAQRRFE